MRQLANFLDTEWASPEWFGTNQVFSRDNQTFDIKRSFVTLSANEIWKFNQPYEKLKEIHTQYDIRLVHPYLGALFYGFCFANPNTFLKNNLKKSINLSKSSKLARASVHLRGEDFLNKNHNDSWAADGRWKLGVHSYEFYKSCTQQILDDVKIQNKKLDKFVICTTAERSHPNLKKYLSFLEENQINYKFGLDENCPIDCGNDEYFKDWYQMAASDYIITCPSVFSLTAGYFSDAKILFNYEWVKSSSDVGDKFWYDLFSGGNEFYSTWKYIDNDGTSRQHGDNIR
jgi:hypothetical protein